jgi:hypothetical protein
MLFDNFLEKIDIKELFGLEFAALLVLMIK